MFGATGRNHGSFQVKSQIKVLNLSQTTVLTQSLCSIVHISISIFNSGRVWRVLLPFGIQPLDSAGSDSWHCSGHLFPQVLRSHLRAYIHVQPNHHFRFSPFFWLFSYSRQNRLVIVVETFGGRNLQNPWDIMDILGEMVMNLHDLMVFLEQ